MQEIFEHLHEDKHHRCAVLSGNGMAFSSGIDLMSFKGLLDKFQHGEPPRVALQSRKLIGGIQKAFMSLGKVRKCFLVIECFFSVINQSSARFTELVLGEV